MSPICLPETDVFQSIRKCLCAISVVLSLCPLAGIHTAIRVKHCALPIVHAVIPLAIVLILARVGLHTDPVFLAANKLSFVGVAVCVPLLAVAKAEVIIKVAVEVRRIMVHFAALAMPLVLHPHAVIEGPITSRERAVAVSLSCQLVDLALINTTVMVLDVWAILTQDFSCIHVYLRSCVVGSRLLLLLLLLLFVVDSLILVDFCPQFLVLR